MTTARRRWLVAAALAVAAYGVALVVAGPAAARVFDALGFGTAAGGVPEGPARSHVLFVYGILGAVLTGWMLTVAALAARPPQGTSHAVRRAVGLPLAAWFVLDTGLSLGTGRWQHALFNVAFLALLGAPLATRAADPGPAVPDDGRQPRSARVRGRRPGFVRRPVHTGPDRQARCGTHAARATIDGTSDDPAITGELPEEQGASPQ